VFHPELGATHIYSKPSCVGCLWLEQA